jgi:isopenicillin-N epimerase
VRSLFSIPNDLLYFNSANLSFCPNSVNEAIDTHRRKFEMNPSLGLKTVGTELWQTQSLLARFFNAQSTDIFLRPNVTEALNAFILGYPLKPQDEILVGELEYGSVFNICRFKAEQEKLSLRVLKMPQTSLAFKELSQEGLIKHIESQLSPQTRLLVLSHVLAGLGLQIPILNLSKITKALGITLAIDGAYAPGALPIDFSQFQSIDFYGCSLYKWMLGPKGTGFGWVNPIHHSKLKPIMAGWSTFESSGPISQFGKGNRFQEKFQLVGCRDFSPFLALKELLSFWNHHGSKQIQTRIWNLNQYFRNKLEQVLSITALRSPDPNLHAPMTVFRVPQKFQKIGAKLAEQLLDEGKIQFHFTELNSGWYGIFSAHIYNSEKEIDEGIDRMRILMNTAAVH